MLKRAVDAEFVEVPEVGFFRKRKKLLYFKLSKSNSVRSELSQQEYEELLEQQQLAPMLVHSDGARRYWAFQDKVYYETDGLEPDDIRALVLENERKLAKRIARAHLLGERDSLEPQRELIPDDVKAFVWQRDQGKCVACGSNELLEFDHIISVKLGGSNTARNLQLLCEPCNRQKGANLS